MPMIRLACHARTIKALHTAIYAVMVAAIFYVIYCGVSGTMNVLLEVSIGIVGLERAAFFELRS